MLLICVQWSALNWSCLAFMTRNGLSFENMKPMPLREPDGHSHPWADPQARSCWKKSVPGAMGTGCDPFRQVMFVLLAVAPAAVSKIKV